MSAGEGIRAGMAYVEGVFKDEKMTAGLKRGQAHFKAFAGTIKKAGLEMAAAGSAISAPFLLALNTFRKNGAALDDMAKRTGVSVEALSELKFAAEQSGATLENVEAGIKSMDRSLLKLEAGVPSIAKAFDELGLSAEDFRGKLPADQLGLIAKQIAAVEDPTRRAALAMKILGGSGQTLLPMIEELAELRQQARDMGFVMSGDAAAAAAELDDKLNILKFAFEGVQQAVGAAVVPLAIDFLAGLQKVASSATVWIANNQALVSGIAKFGAILTVTGAGLLAISTTITSATTIISALTLAASGAQVAIAAMCANPVIAGIVLLGTTIAILSTQMGDARSEAEKLRDAVNGIKPPPAPVMGVTADGKERAMTESELKIAAKGGFYVDRMGRSQLDNPTGYDKDNANVRSEQLGLNVKGMLDSIFPESDRKWLSDWQEGQAKRDADRTPFAQARGVGSQAFGALMNAPNEAMNAVSRAIEAALHSTDQERAAADLAQRQAEKSRAIDDERNRALIDAMPEGKGRDLARIDNDEQTALRELKESGMFSQELQNQLIGLYSLQRSLVNTAGPEAASDAISSMGTLRGDLAGQQLGGLTIDDKQWETQKQMLKELRDLTARPGGLIVGN